MLSPPAIEISNLTVSFAVGEIKKTVLSITSLVIPPASSIVIVGETGSGKSTLVKSMLGLLPEEAIIEQGTLKIQGVTMPFKDDLSWHQYRGKFIAVILQNPALALNPIMSCGEQLKEVFRHVNGLDKTQALEQTKAMLHKVGFEHEDKIFSAYPFQLSGGQQQRVCIAMALAGGCKVLIADEPMSALDMMLKAELLQLLKDLQAQIGFTLVLVTHDLGMAKQVSNQWHVMYQGEIIYTGSTNSGEQDVHPYVSLLQQRSLALSDVAHRKGAESEALIFKVKDLSFSYEKDGREVLQDISFEVREGVKLGVLGASGTGKSTLAKILAGLIIHYRGTVEFCNVAIQTFVEKNPISYFSKVQYILQDSAIALPPHLSVGTVLTDTVRAFDLSLSSNAALDRVKQLLALVQLDATFLTKRRNAMSGGEKQRIAIARALAANPKVMILDESLSALDKSVQFKMVQLLNEIQRQINLTIIVVAHDVQLITHFCDHLLIMKAGQINAQGPTMHLIEDPPTTFSRELLTRNL